MSRPVRVRIIGDAQAWHDALTQAQHHAAALARSLHRPWWRRLLRLP